MTTSTNPATRGYTQLGTGYWVKDDDVSGPYVFDGATFTLAGSGAGGGGGGGGGAVTMAANSVAAGAYKAGSLVDGADATQGLTTDAAVAAGAAGTLSAKLRRLTADIGAMILQLPTTLGAKTIAASLSVTTATDQLGIATASITTVAASATSTQLLAANAARRRTIITNESASATLYLKFGTTASATSYTAALLPGDIYESPVQPVYTGRIDGIWTAAVGNARITEM